MHIAPRILFVSANGMEGVVVCGPVEFDELVELSDEVLPLHPVNRASPHTPSNEIVLRIIFVFSFMILRWHLLA